MNEGGVAVGSKANTYKLSPKEIIFKYIIYFPLLVLSLSISIAIAYIYLRYQVPYYSSSINLIVKDDKTSKGGGGGGGDALEDIVLFKSKINLANEIEILKSATLMERVVRKLNLNTQYTVEGNLKKAEAYNGQIISIQNLSYKDSNCSYYLVLKFDEKNNFKIDGFPKKWYKAGEVISCWFGDFKIVINNASGINPEYKYIIQHQPSFQTASSLASGLFIRQLNTQASILKISITTEIPQKGVDILNQLVIAYNTSTVENKNKVIDNTLKFIDNRLIFLNTELAKVEKGFQEYRQQNQIIDVQQQGFENYTELKKNEEELRQLNLKIANLNSQIDYLKNPSRKFNAVPSAFGIDDQTLVGLVSRYNNLQLDREEKIKVMPIANPKVQSIEGQIEKVRVSILENLNNIIKSLNPTIAKLKSDNKYLANQVFSVPAKERDMLGITRQQGIKEKLYLFLLQKREETAITMAANTSTSYSVDPAVVYWLPISPDRSGTIRMAIIIGLLIPIGFIYLRDILNDKIIERADVNRATSMPIIGEISHHKMADREVVIGDKDRSIIAEQFRIARTNLQFFITNKKSPVVLVTSSMAGEGKTFTSMNLGAVWAVANKKTVILELDLRKPKISKALGLLDRKGISNYIIGDASKEELPVMVKSTINLYVVPAGPIPPNPSELLLDEKIDQLFEYLKTQFDIIIIDSAPLGLVSDAKVLSRFADSIVYVVRQRYTPKKQMVFVDELYQSKTFTNISLLVNDVRMEGYNSYYGYGYGYSYGYGYGSKFNYSVPYGYLEKDKESKSIFKRIFKKG